MKSLLSLVIPIYNAEKYLRQALESVKKQTLDKSKFEVVIVDDGSSDRTPEIVEEWKLDMVNAHFHRRIKNKGTPFTRNEAISKSAGEYIVNLDSDDLLEPGALEATLKFMEERQGVQYSYSKYRVINANGKLICEQPSYDYHPEKLIHFNFIGHLKCFSKRLHNDLGGYDLSLKTAEDWDFVLRASEFLKEDQIARNPIFLYQYRFHKDNITNKGKKDGSGEEDCLNVVRKALFRRGINGNVFYVGRTSDGAYSYYDWTE